MDKKNMENYLLVLKSTVEVYVHGTQESSNQDIRNLFNESLNKILNSQRDTYDLMKENNWYNVQNVTIDVIQNTLTKLQSNMGE